MIALVLNLIAAVMIGYGTGSWLVGLGVALIAVNSQFYFNTAIQTTHANITRNLGKIFNKIS